MRLLLPLFWLRAPAKVGASGRSESPPRAATTLATAFPWSGGVPSTRYRLHPHAAGVKPPRATSVSPLSPPGRKRASAVSAEDRAALPSLWRRRIRKRSEMITARHSRQLQAVEPGHVLPHDHPRFLLRDVLAVPRDDLAGIRPGRNGMGVIGRPHDVLHPDELPRGHPYRIVDERREHLAPEILGRPELQRRRVQVAVLFLRLIELLQEEGEPAHLVFCRDDLQVGESLEHAREDQHDQRALHFMTEHCRADVAVERGLDREPAFRAHPGDAVKTDGYPDLLRCSPERIIVGGAVRPVFRRRGPDECALQASLGAAPEL